MITSGAASKDEHLYPFFFCPNSGPPLRPSSCHHCHRPKYLSPITTIRSNWEWEVINSSKSGAVSHLSWKLKPAFDNRTIFSKILIFCPEGAAYLLRKLPISSTGSFCWCLSLSFSTATLYQAIIVITTRQADSIKVYQSTPTSRLVRLPLAGGSIHSSDR